MDNSSQLPMDGDAPIKPDAPRQISFEEIFGTDKYSMCRQCVDKRWLDCDLGHRSAADPNGLNPPCSNCRFFGGPTCECGFSHHPLRTALFYQTRNGSQELSQPVARGQQDLMLNIPATWQGNPNTGPPPSIPVEVCLNPRIYLGRGVTAGGRVQGGAIDTREGRGASLNTTPPELASGSLRPFNIAPSALNPTQSPREPAIGNGRVGRDVRLYWDWADRLHLVTTLDEYIDDPELAPQPGLDRQSNLRQTAFRGRQEDHHRVRRGQRSRSRRLGPRQPYESGGLIPLDSEAEQAEEYPERPRFLRTESSDETAEFNATMSDGLSETNIPYEPIPGMTAERKRDIRAESDVVMAHAKRTLAHDSIQSEYARDLTSHELLMQEVAQRDSAARTRQKSSLARARSRSETSIDRGRRAREADPDGKKSQAQIENARAALDE